MGILEAKGLQSIAAALMSSILACIVGRSAHGGVPIDESPTQAKQELRKLSHDETLRWIGEHKAWRQAHKTRPIWARAVTPAEVGKEFQTADHVKEVAREGYWLCVGSAGEPWFQTREKIDSKYEPGDQETKRFAFDVKPATYQVFKPKGASRNWVAQVKGPGIEGFFIKPGYDPDRPLYSPAGGYVVKDNVPDPNRDKPTDVWLVQKSLFESTYEIVQDEKAEEKSKDGTTKGDR